ncbi:hypothetical protein M9Y10_045708 [Tritrichomonas musculus]|uniref:Uncharacterized protein n=1 Tax=Tritrichomonas musculus TaxID=1915356 RepID=A0ABR2JW56_9EUKA
MKSRFEIDRESSIDNLLIARKLAQFGPTSLSIDDFKLSRSPSSPTSILKNSHLNNKTLHKESSSSFDEKDQKIEYIPPSPSVKIENTSNEQKSIFKLGIQPAKHRFGFLMTDIKPIRQSASTSNIKSSPNSPSGSFRMKYELPNIKKVSAPVKSAKPLMVVSFSTTSLNDSNKNDMKSVSDENNQSPLIRKSPKMQSE